MSSNLKIERLRDRAFMLGQARLFFEKQHVIEVDCPILTTGASVDAHIDLMPVLYNSKDTRYMHSSPEYGMKRLLAEGMGDIFQLSHVFRDGEYGIKHNPEFMMAEWYRLGFSLEQMIDDTVAFIRLFLGQLPCQIKSYRETLIQHTGLDYIKLSEKDLLQYIQENKIPCYANVQEDGKDALLNLILSAIVEPKLGHEELYVLAYYPASQAALAKKRWHGEEQVAERFEVYYKGVELANGYHELTDAVEQRQRFIEANQLRAHLGKNQLPLDEYFLKALEKGLPDCSGVAVGFDRLMMLRHQEKDLAAVIPWSWGIA